MRPQGTAHARLPGRASAGRPARQHPALWTSPVTAHPPRVQEPSAESGAEAACRGRSRVPHPVPYLAPAPLCRNRIAETDATVFAMYDAFFQPLIREALPGAVGQLALEPRQAMVRVRAGAAQRCLLRLSCRSARLERRQPGRWRRAGPRRVRVLRRLPCQHARSAAPCSAPLPPASSRQLVTPQNAAFIRKCCFQ